MLVSNSYQPFTFCQFPGGANQITCYNHNVFLFLDKTLLAQGCELSTEFWFARSKFLTTGCIRRWHQQVSNQFPDCQCVFFQGDGKCATLGSLAIRSASLGAHRALL